MRELQRLQLAELCRTWKLVADGGFCTMNAPLSSWVQTRAQVESATQKRYLGLKPMARMLQIPGCDTLITCLIYVTVLRIADDQRGGDKLNDEMDI
jgi:hypothetical protein